jgi:hypothetical protein
VPFPSAAAAVVRDDLHLLLLDKPSLSRRRFPIRQKGDGPAPLKITTVVP